MSRDRAVPSAPPAVSVVVPTRDRVAPLRACLVALEAQDAPSFEVVVVDDASTDAEAVARVVAGAPRARQVQGAGRGPAAARNRGAAEARASIICFTDDDCRPGPGWIGALATALEGGVPAAAGPTRNGRPGLAVAAASQAVTNHLTDSSACGDGHVGFAPTSNVAARREVLAAVPFDEHYPLAAGEDRDWCARLAAEGIALSWVPEAWVDHHQDLDLAGFWRQQERYGRGAHRVHASADRGRRLQHPSFYWRLLRRGVVEGWDVGALVALAQVATASGAVREAWAARRR